MIDTIWRPLNSKIIFLEVGTLNFVFYISIYCRRYMKLFMKISQIVCVHGYTKNSITLRPIKREFLVSCIFVYLAALSIMKITYVFAILENILNTNIVLIIKFPFTVMQGKRKLCE